MIQFKRGTRESWRLKNTVLEPGQPGYDKTRNKIKIGDGVHGWSSLKYASGLSDEEILDSEVNARNRNKLDNDDKTIFTYGTDAPTDKTAGQVYLQYQDTEPEADYIVASGTNNGWHYQKWYYGSAKCWCTIKVSAILNDLIDCTSLYRNTSNIKGFNYPFNFIETPTENVTVHSEGPLAWLAGCGNINNNKKTAEYCIISPSANSNEVNYYLSFTVYGTWRTKN